MSATPSAAPLPPGATLGVLGGGQLGRMFAHAAQSLGWRVAVLDPDRASPAGAVAERHIEAGYLDEAGLNALAAACAAVTTEFENVPAAALRRLAEAGVRVAPAAAAVEICQDRAAEKAHFQRAGVPCAPFAVIRSAADLARPETLALLPGILKTARLGYDGKGQAGVANAEELAAAWRRLGQVDCVLEQRLPLAHELSVIVARGFDGTVVALPVQQNLHRDGILAVTQVPAPAVDAALARQAQRSAEQLAASMDYVGVLCVEFFVLTEPLGGAAAPPSPEGSDAARERPFAASDGRLVANEMAPRPHNSGHYSIDACDISQFELQARALAGLPLVTPRLHSPAFMLNLLGDLWFAGPGAPREPDWPAVLALPGAHLHLYGKAEPRPGRKMGHLTVTAASADEAYAVALQAAARLGLPPF